MTESGSAASATDARAAYPGPRRRFRIAAIRDGIAELEPTSECEGCRGCAGLCSLMQVRRAGLDQWRWPLSDLAMKIGTPEVGMELQTSLDATITATSARALGWPIAGAFAGALAVTALGADDAFVAVAAAIGLVGGRLLAGRSATPAIRVETVDAASPA